MDHVVDHHGGLIENSVAGAKRSKSCLNTSLSKAFASPQKVKSRTSSNESEYEVVAEIDNEDSENEACSVDEGDPDQNDNNVLVGLNNTSKINHTQISAPSEPVEMDEVFVIVDDDAETPDETTEPRETSEEKRNCLSDGDDLEMDEIIAEFAEQEKKTVPQLSDNEEEMDSILNEFAKSNSNNSTNDKKSDANIILSSESEDEMDCLLEEFRKESTPDNDTLAKKTELQNKDISSNRTEKSSDNVTNTCDNKNDNVRDSQSKFQSSNNSNSSSHNDQNNSSMQEHDSSADKNSIHVKSECILICDSDDKSNNSNCSSVEILLDEDPVKEVNQIISFSEKEKMPSEVLSCSVSQSPSNNLSDAEKNEFNKTTVNASNENSDCVNSNIEATNDICENIFDTNASEASASVTESSGNSNLDSSNKFIDTVNTNSKDETNDQIKIAEGTAENVCVNKILNDSEPLPVNKEISETEKHSNDSSLITDDQIVSNNEIEQSNDVESNALSETNEKVTFEKSMEFDSTDIVKDDISSADADKGSDEKAVQVDQNKSLQEEKEDKIILNAISIADDSMSLKDLNETYVDKDSEKSEISMETNVVNNSSQSKENNEDEKLTVESESDEVEKIKLDTEESCTTAALQTEVKEFSDITKSCIAEDFYISVDSPLSGEFNSEADDKKRKLEDAIDIDSKRLKIDNTENGDSNYLNGEESLTSITSGDIGLKNTNKEELIAANVPNHKTVDKVAALIPWNKAECIESTNKVLDKIAAFVCQAVVKECFQKMYIKDKNTALELERKSGNLAKHLDALRLQFADLRDAQKIAFAEQNFKAKVHTRTVGVNVKIYRESEIKQALSLQSVLKNKPGVISETPSDKSEKLELKTEPKTEPSSVISNIKTVKPGTAQSLVPNANLKDTVITPMVTPQQANIRRQLLPRIISQTNRPLVATQVMSRMIQKIPPPNVTVNGNRIVPLVSSRGRTPSPQSVFIVPSTRPPTRSNTIDLTKEDQARNAANGTTIPNPTVTKVTVPGIPNNSNVLVPLRDYLQLLPPQTKGSPILQQAPVSRPALIPQLPSNLLGARTVTYLVPQNSGIGARGIPQFIPPSNQQVQFVLRVTNPGTAPTLTPVVNSISRPATMPQTQVTPAPRPSSGLILFSHTSKHPAPFPKSPHYPDTKGKALPPKPSLKGSKNSNGIVLSWNMCLMRNHANISSYQLFAYQETEGPVDSSLWKKVGDVNALPLPMACTLTQFVDKNRYYFTVRAVDTYQRFGPFSDPVSILYDKEEASSTKK